MIYTHIHMPWSSQRCRLWQTAT